MLHRLLVPLIAILLPTLASAQSGSTTLTANTATYAPAGGTVTFTATMVYPTGRKPTRVKLTSGWFLVGEF